MRNPFSTRRTVGLIGAFLGLSVVLGVGAVRHPAAATGAAARPYPTPVARDVAGGAVPMTGFFDGFETGTAGWCDQPAGGMGFGPCDGVVNGPVVRVPSGTVRGPGSYAAGPLPAATGDGYAAVTGAPNAGATCSAGAAPSVPCRGPYTDWGQPGAPGHTAFPAFGFTTSIDVYLDTAWAAAHAESRFDWAVVLDGPGALPAYQYVFNVGTSPPGYPGGAGFVVDAGLTSGRAASSPESCPAGSAPAACGRPVLITSSGWYRFTHRFAVTGTGQVTVEMTVTSETTGAAVSGADWSPYGAPVAPGAIDGVWGGFPNEEIPGLPVDDAQLVVGADFSPAGPVRICDTRPGNPGGLSGPAAQCDGGPGDLGHTLGPGDVVPVRVEGIGGLPTAGVTGAVLDVTAFPRPDVPASGSSLTVWPDGADRPDTTSVSVAPGRPTSVQVVSGVGPEGLVDVYDSAGHVDVTVDVQGYYSADSTYGFASVGPAAVCDTAAGNPRALTGPAAQCNGAAGAGTPLGAAQTKRIQVAGLPGVPATGAAAVVLDVTAAGHPDVPGVGSSLTVWPDGTSRPAVSDLDYGAGQVVSNQVTVPLGAGGGVDLYNTAGTVDLVVDLVGWYGTAAGDQFTAPYPTRICDTRPADPSGLRGWEAGCGGPGQQGGTLGSGATLTLGSAGASALVGPAAGALSLVATATVLGHDLPPWGTFVTAWAAGTPRPGNSPLIGYSGLAASGSLTVPAGTGGIDVYNAVGPVDVTVDVTGYFSPLSIPTVLGVEAGAPPPVGGGSSGPPPPPSKVPPGHPATQTTGATLAFTGPQGPDSSAGSPPGSGSSGPTPAELKSQCLASLSNEISRQLSYRPQQHMEVGQDTVVTAVLGTGHVAPVPGGVVVNIPTTCEVDAKLSGDGFSIQTQSPEVQSFVDSPLLTWTWDVTPLRSGPNLTLDLYLQSKFSGGGLDVTGHAPPFVARINVLAAPESLGHRASTVLYNPFLDALLSSGLLALGFGVVRERMKGKQRRAAAELAEEEEERPAVRTARPAAARSQAAAPAASRAAPPNGQRATTKASGTPTRARTAPTKAPSASGGSRAAPANGSPPVKAGAGLVSHAKAPPARKQPAASKATKKALPPTEAPAAPTRRSRPKGSGTS